MGLDMYMRGKKYPRINKEKQEDGFDISYTMLELAYWRKHPDLHGYIVQTYAGGLDECQMIYLGAKAIRDIIKATANDELPHTEGFFFGSSTGYDPVEDCAMLNKVLEWLETEDEDTYKTVYYQASW